MRKKKNNTEQSALKVPDTKNVHALMLMYYTQMTYIVFRSPRDNHPQETKGQISSSNITPCSLQLWDNKILNKMQNQKLL